MTVLQRIYEVVKEIPAGRVATYGQIALRAGNPRWARVVGYALHNNPLPGVIPCHRVVNRLGKPAETFAFGGGSAQRTLLEGEGVVFCEDGRVDLERYGWQGVPVFSDGCVPLSAEKQSALLMHPIPPVYDAHSRILILGSFPSVKSREEGFFYGHPRNRFWKVLAGVWETPVPVTVAEKKGFLLRHGIALWDVLAGCEITGSADSSIHHALPNDSRVILDCACIQTVFVNGKTALRYYDRYWRETVGQKAVCLPSTSPANAAWSLERLTQAWKVIRT